MVKEKRKKNKNSGRFISHSRNDSRQNSEGPCGGKEEG